MPTKTLSIRRDVLAQAHDRAESFRRRMTAAGTLVVNLVSSPGSGKTTLLEATARCWAGRRKMAVLVGDLETDRDARRLQPWTPALQLTTGGACHLELPLVERGCERLAVSGLEFLFIENVGNLVCPASHDLGEHFRVVVLSTTEGDDKPGKYPKMFRTSQAMVVSKLDLLPHVLFSLDAVVADARRVQPQIHVLPVCATRGEGVDRWCTLLEIERRKRLAASHVVDHDA